MFNDKFKEESLESDEAGLLNVDPYDVETYTVSQVMKLLNVSRKTVYNMHKDKRIVGHTYKVDGKPRTLFTQESIKAELDKRKAMNVVTVPELAKKYNTSSASILNILRKHNIPYELNETDFARKTSTLTQENCRLFEAISAGEFNDDSKRRSSFVYKGYALYQLFKDTKGTLYRLRKQEDVWGFVEGDTFLKLEKALRMGFSPIYTIHTKKLASRGKYYATFDCSLLDNQTFEWIDFLYTTIAIRDLHFEQVDSLHVRIRVKASFIELNQDKVSFEWLEKHLTIGDLILDDDSLTLEIVGSHKTTSFAVPIDLSKSLHEMSLEQDVPQSVIIEEALRIYLESAIRNK